MWWDTLRRSVASDTIFVFLHTLTLHPHTFHTLTLHPHILTLHTPTLHPHILTLSVLSPSTLPLSTLPPSTLTQPIMGVHSQKVLEEAKYYMQEQLLRKAAQKEALAAMDQEQQR